MKKAVLALIIGFFLIVAVPTFAQTSTQLSTELVNSTFTTMRDLQIFVLYTDKNLYTVATCEGARDMGGNEKFMVSTESIVSPSGVIATRGNFTQEGARTSGGGRNWQRLAGAKRRGGDGGSEGTATYGDTDGGSGNGQGSLLGVPAGTRVTGTVILPRGTPITITSINAKDDRVELGFNYPQGYAPITASGTRCSEKPNLTFVFGKGYQHQHDSSMMLITSVLNIPKGTERARSGENASDATRPAEGAADKSLPTPTPEVGKVKNEQCPAGMVHVSKGFGSYCVSEQTEKAAKKADAPPQCDTAVMYENQKNYLEATSWYMLCADRGNVDAEYKVGTMYEDGKGVDQSYQMAEHWYKRAAEHGNADAQYKLGSMLEDGKGMYHYQSYKEALSWYQMAAEHGNAVAQNHLGEMYEKGKGVPHDLQQALYWYGKAAGVNDNAKNRLRELNTELDEKQKAQAQQLELDQKARTEQERIERRSLEAAKKARLAANPDNCYDSASINRMLEPKTAATREYFSKVTTMGVIKGFGNNVIHVLPKGPDGQVLLFFSALQNEGALRRLAARTISDPSSRATFCFQGFAEVRFVVINPYHPDRTIEKYKTSASESLRFIKR